MGSMESYLLLAVAVVGVTGAKEKLLMAFLMTLPFINASELSTGFDMVCLYCNLEIGNIYYY